MIIVGLTAIFAGQTLDITPYPFARDCVFYGISIIMLVLFLLDGQVEWWEALLLLLGYFAYIGFMTQNEKVAAALERRKRSRKRAVEPSPPSLAEQSSQPSMTNVAEPNFTAALSKDVAMNPRLRAIYHPAHDGVRPSLPSLLLHPGPSS
jgi:Ca2+/Na+ antiporter